MTSLATSATALFNTTNGVYVGDQGNVAVGGTNPFTGQVAAIRITKGVARYGAGNFTPPSLPLPHC